MAKISTYPIDSSVSLADYVIGTDAEDSNITKNYTIGSLIALAALNIDLAEVLTAGNTATNNITLTGNITCTNFQATGTISDSSSSVGTAGQLLSSTATGTQWVNPNSGLYINAYVATPAVTTIGSQGVEVPLNFTYTQGLASSFTALNNRVTYAGTETKVFAITITATVTGTAGDSVSFLIAKNGLSIASSAQEVSISQGSAKPVTATLQTIQSLATNDNIGVQVINNSGANNITTTHLNTNVVIV
jgi:hypothetical protein